MWGEAVLAAISIGHYIYHRWFDEPSKPTPAPELTLPRVDDGAPYPILYGTCRAKSPVIAWIDRPLYAHCSTDDDITPIIGGEVSGIAPTDFYFASMLLVIGIPFNDGRQQLLSMWSGDLKFKAYSDIGTPAVEMATLLGDIHAGGTDYRSRFAEVYLPDPQVTARLGTWGMVEFLNGHSDQQLVQRVSPYDAYSQAGRHMVESVTYDAAKNWANTYGVLDLTLTSGYRGFLSVFLYNDSRASLLTWPRHWSLGRTPSVPAYSFEIRTLPETYLGPDRVVPTNEGDISHDQGDANPVDVLYDLLTGTRGKLGIATSRIHLASFQAAAQTLYDEGNGFSYAFTQSTTANDMIEMILKQIDGVIYEDPTDGSIHLKLIRNDYDPLTIPVINPTNCVSVKNFAAGGWTDIPNKVRVSYSNRLDNYNDDSATAHNQANALGQDGEVREIQIQMPGVTTWGNATAIAGRELMARSRPLIKCRVIVDRTFRNIVPGDVVKLSWPKWKLSNAVMRVASVNRGTVASNSIALDLIQDYFYVWRSRPPIGGGGSFLAPPPAGGAPLLIV